MGLNLNNQKLQYITKPIISIWIIKKFYIGYIVKNLAWYIWTYDHNIQHV